MNEASSKIHTERVRTYTKRDVAAKVAQLTSEKRIVAEKWVDNVFAALRGIMLSAKPQLRIEVRDFGVFEVKRTKPKPRARNPRTGETIFVPAHLKTHFKPSKRLKSFLQRPLEAELTPASSVEPAAPLAPESGQNNGQADAEESKADSS